jgi:predicted alpha-1,2-mannosidase
MPVIMTISLGLLLLIFSQCKPHHEPESLARLVNPFIGTGGHGHTFPGATLPFGMVQLSPDTRLEGWDGCSGYHYDDKKIYGFSHTHLSGTGVADYCDVLLLPFQGKTLWKNTAYASPFSHSSEQAWAGYYAVTLEAHNIRAELTATRRCGIHRYTFNQTGKAPRLLLDLEHRDKVLDSWLEVVSDTEVVGFRRSASWNPDQHLYFCIRFNTPAIEIEAALNNRNVTFERRLEGTSLKAAFTFKTEANPLVVRVGLSAVSADNARMNLEAEASHNHFDRYVAEAELAWNRELELFEITGGSEEEKRIFYTAWYHCLIAPNLFSDVNGEYRGRDGKPHRAEGFEYYTVFSLWDTYRALHPLLALTHPKQTRDWVLTFLRQYEEGGALPVWELASAETHCMIGYHAVPVILEAWVRGIRDFNAKKALEAMVKAATDTTRIAAQYQTQGFISGNTEAESVSKTVEYSFDDWCIAQFAKYINQQDVYKLFRKRAYNYRNLFDPETRFLRGKIEAFWYVPFDPYEVNNFFTEANAWQYALAAVHDLNELIQLHGGDSTFASFLERLFTDRTLPTGRQQADITGLLGQYAHGNEPSHHLAYLFNYCGRPWRTQELVHFIRKNFYKNSPDGLIGNEDCGQMSAWYVLSAMGFYPVTPGSGYMSLGTPLFPRIKLKLGNGHTLEIRTTPNNTNNPYVKNLRLNGRNYDKLWLGPELFQYGGQLEFTLSDKPATPGPFSAEQMRPPLRREDAGFVAVPGLLVSANPFRDSATLTVNHIDAQSLLKLWWPDSHATFRGSKTITVKKPGMIMAQALKGPDSSCIVIGKLARVIPDRHITLLTEPTPPYQSHGPNILIDSIMSGPQWRNGLWHSYFGKDFRAVIDLGTSRKLQYGAIHVLQETQSWIFYPREVIFEGSRDGKVYFVLRRFKNRIPSQEGPAETQILGGRLRGKWRYVRVRAVNGGPLPEWHENKGQPAHLFIDEVIITTQ